MDYGPKSLLQLRTQIPKADRPVIVILSGAGLSAESGIPTYRNPDNSWSRSDSLNAGHMRNAPQIVFDSMNRRINAYTQAKPNSAHVAIAEFRKTWRHAADIVHITQNIDTLCEDAGDAGVFHLHGSFLTSRCRQCGAVFPRLGFYREGNICPACKAAGFSVRPDVVLFEEMPLGMDWIPEVIKRADIFLAIGTSGVVYPAAGFVTLALKHGCHDRILIAKDALSESFLGLATAEDCVGDFTKFLRGSATTLVPAVLQTIGDWIGRITQKTDSAAAQPKS